MADYVSITWPHGALSEAQTESSALRGDALIPRLRTAGDR